MAKKILIPLIVVVFIATVAWFKRIDIMLAFVKNSFRK